MLLSMIIRIELAHEGGFFFKGNSHIFYVLLFITTFYIGHFIGSVGLSYFTTSTVFNNLVISANFCVKFVSLAYYVCYMFFTRYAIPLSSINVFGIGV